MIPRIALVVLLLAAGPAPAWGQSLFNAGGIGVPTDPLDGRTRALGGVGIGLRGAVLLASDPAAAAGYLLPTIVLTAQPTWVEFSRERTDEEGTFRGTRFPSMGIAYPTIASLVATLTLESFLDQRYESSSTSTVPLGSGEVEVRDAFVSQGGVSQLRLGVARRLTPALAVGLSVGRYTGSSTRRLTRDFGPGVDTMAIQPFQAGGFWSYSGTSVNGGASMNLGTVARVAASLTWSGALNATASHDTEGDSRSYDVPLQFRVGGSALLAPGLAVSASLSSADWSAVDGKLRGSSSTGRVESYGAGLELTRARLLGRTAPLRLGYRRAELPFALGTGTPTESVWAGGMGLHLSEVGEVVRAAVDLGVERGTRSDSDLSERFWRSTLTVRISGF